MLLAAGILIIGGLFFFDVIQLPSFSSQSQPQQIPDKLKIEDLKKGTGKEAKSGDTVTVQYVGKLENGTVFDSSYTRKQPFTTQIGTGQVIAGWDQGIPGMRVGGKRRLTIPPSLGYGDQGQGAIPPNATLIFEIELLDVK